MAIPAPDDTALPERYRAARFTTFDDVMPTDWLGKMGVWLHSQRGLFRRGGDEGGLGRFGYELVDVDTEYQPVADLRSEILKRVDEAVKRVGVPDFAITLVETHATLYHHGGRYTWHNDSEASSTRRLSFALYIHSEPAMFSGGELEFLDGATVKAKHNRLVFFDPDQQHRVRPVECWSAEFLHGRWAISGWIHGEPQEPTT